MCPVDLETLGGWYYTFEVPRKSSWVSWRKGFGDQTVVSNCPRIKLKILKFLTAFGTRYILNWFSGATSHTVIIITAVPIFQRSDTSSGSQSAPLCVIDCAQQALECFGINWVGFNWIQLGWIEQSRHSTQTFLKFQSSKTQPVRGLCELLEV